MTSTTYDHLVTNVESAVRFARLLDALLEGVDVDGLPADLAETLSDYEPDPDEYADDDLSAVLLNSAALEVYGNARVTAGRVDVREVVVVTGTGGPHVEFGIDYAGRVIGRGYWGSDSVERGYGGTLEVLGGFLAELVGGWDQDR